MVQMPGLQTKDVQADLVDASGKIIQSQTIFQGSTICYFNVATLYSGTYFVKITAGNQTSSFSVVIAE
jgi:hypothetical protein